MPWMTDLYNNEPLFPQRPLHQITIPGTHDAGCYINRLLNFQSRTQGRDVLGQLTGGIRYFDIRPYRNNAGQIWTYHGPFYTGDQVDGANGILQQVSNFMQVMTANDRELVILNISHFNGFNAAAHQQLIQEIQNRLGNFLVPHNQGQGNLFNMSMQNLLTDAMGVTSSRVAILYDGALDTPLEPYVNVNNLPVGFFKLSPKYNIGPNSVNPIYLFDQYANCSAMQNGPIRNGMVPNQMDKLNNRQNYAYTGRNWGNNLGNWFANGVATAGVNSTLHLFSWTLTPQPWSDPITAAQQTSNPQLLPQFTGNNWTGGNPYDIRVDNKINIIYVDDFDSEIANNANGPRLGLAMPVAISDYLNRYMNNLGQFVWNGWGNF